MDLSFLPELASEARNFTPADGLAVATLAVLEGILSVDNSLVLAILVRELPKDQQKKALTWGIAGAFFFRFLALVFATHLIKFAVFKLIGGGYLVYLAMKHMFFFYKEDAHQPSRKSASSLWKVVLIVELTDIAFSIDSITTAVAMSKNLLVVWLGGILGIIFLRFAASLFVRLLDVLPRLEDLAYQLIFFVGTKLLLEGFHLEIEISVFWLMMAVIAVLGASLVYRDYYKRKTEDSFQSRLLERLRRGKISAAEILALEYVPQEVLAFLLDRGDLSLNQKKNVQEPEKT